LLLINPARGKVAKRANTVDYESPGRCSILPAPPRFYGAYVWSAK
jgi:hypothetical protein